MHSSYKLHIIYLHIIDLKSFVDMDRREGRWGGKSRAQPRADGVGLHVWALGNDLAHLPPLLTQGAALGGGRGGSFPSFEVWSLVSRQYFVAFKKLVFVLYMAFLAIFSGRICPHHLAPFFKNGFLRQMVGPEGQGQNLNPKW